MNDTIESLRRDLATARAEVAQAVDQRNQALRELEEARDYVGRELLAARAEVTALRLEAEAAVNMRETFSRTLEENVALRALLVIGLERCDCPLGACATFCNPTRAFLDGRRDDAPLTYKADGVYRGTERLRLARDEGSRELDYSGEPLAVGDSRDYRVTAEDTWCHKCQSWTCPCPEGRVPRPPERFRMRDEARCTCRHRTSEDRIAGHFKGCPARDEGGAP